MRRRSLRCPVCKVLLPAGELRLRLGLLVTAICMIVASIATVTGHHTDGATARVYAESLAAQLANSDSAAELRRAYSENQRAADLRYNARSVRLSGELVDLSLIDPETLRLKLAEGGSQPSTIADASVTADARVLQLKKGDSVSLVCVCRGMSGGVLTFNGCRLAEARERSM